MWTKQQIRRAGTIELPPLRTQRHYRLEPLNNDNYRITPDTGGSGNQSTVLRRGTGIIVKHNCRS